MAEYKYKTDFLGGYNRYDPEHDGYGNAREWKRSFSNRMSTEEAETILDDDDPWSVLGVQHSANHDEIRKAFYAMAMHWHPDVSHETEENATKMMQKINAAYSLLMNMGQN